METWVSKGYPFAKNPHMEGSRGRMQYHAGEIRLEKILAKHMDDCEGRILVTGKFRLLLAISINDWQFQQLRPFEIKSGKLFGTI